MALWQKKPPKQKAVQDINIKKVIAFIENTLKDNMHKVVMINIRNRETGRPIMSEIVPHSNLPAVLNKAIMVTVAAAKAGVKFASSMPIS